MQGPIEREHTMMAMVTNGQRTAARPAPLLLDCEVDACELRVFWPAIRHEGPLLVQDMVGNQHTIYRPICVLAFYRIVVYFTDLTLDALARDVPALVIGVVGADEFPSLTVLCDHAH